MPRAARRPGAALRAVPRRLRRALPARRPVASCTRSTTCCRSPTTGGSARGRPAPTPTRTSRRSCRSTRPTTGTSGRPTTSSASSSTATRPDPDPDARRLAGPPAAQGLPARRHPGRVQGRRDPAAGRAEGLLDERPRRDYAAAARETTEGTRLHRHRRGLGRRSSAGLGERRRGAHRRQHGSAAPVDPRRAPADPRARGRDGHRGRLRHRLPAHRHREEPASSATGPRASRS